MTRTEGRWSIASRFFAAQLVAVILLSGCLTLALWIVSRQSADDTAARLSLGVSTTLARDPFVIAAVQTSDPTAELEPYALSIVKSAGVDFVTIMDTSGIRYTHPDSAQIGGRFLGTIATALQGESLTETYTGTLGPSVRAVVPVMQGGRVIAIVSAGVTVERVLASLAPRIPLVIGVAVLLVALGTVGALIGRRALSRVTGSMRPAELSRMVGYYESVLHSVREGLILTDDRGRVVLYNDEAADLLGLPPTRSDRPPSTVSELGLPPSIASLIESRVRIVEESHLAGDRVLLVNQEPASPTGSRTRTQLGSLTTLRDLTEVQRLSGELESVRTLSDALRSQTHEYANQLHTVVSLLELGRTREAIELIAHQTQTSQSLADDLVGASSEPALAALLLGKVAQASERGVQMLLVVDDALGASALPISELVSVVGNLVDNAIDAASGDSLHRGSSPATVSVNLASDPVTGVVQCTVTDSGPGIDSDHLGHIFDRGFSTKPAPAAGRGFGLAVVRDILARRGGVVEVAASGPEGTRFVARWPRADRGPM
ncbi:sensor histidine kinase [Frigoribacterium sp. CG_9.8]|uniref:sensor histidine kinase n=1 Tax=Frigoribacterium sp. CG_9.8 TaxID=2787733 RepID=UPI0018CBA62F|nr:sensor histidine kinase [Frigoribacterium sp. CG_9.8]MBG6107753.1 sensor histidine kinase regulating citrate/malate metabolism [Frigoribacterium sp. CG_9.8]